MKAMVFTFFAAISGLLVQAALPILGKPAPAFEAQDQHGKSWKLADFKGKIVVLYFYPKDQTPGCTAQACSLRDGYAQIQGAGAVVLGVSTDDVQSHKAFAEKYSLPFSLLSDPDKKLIQAYGVKSALGLAKRITFVIDAKGILRSILQEVEPKTHDRQVLNAIKGI